ncbi:hypothetical protein M2132_001600 [Dysgonomonas sp. PH5-45]|uniref:hypothetical protein n=1 Tax=unclassified Dysgonomonas TaxID=2630389 RepID=UPI002476D76A|nr:MULTISPECIES: hypothetical protein [unclassified Dysgonomonas]MDH6355262.1 hypothetical protein [Dysgonomonas sp. PH5-45]MDH6388116.1 hypothetical protein [Dysgonomonas sp. PH5-37]
MKIIYNNIFPFKRFAAINIFGFIFARKEYGVLSAHIINHEAIHTAQMKELLYIFFYLWYTVEWTAKWIRYRNPDRAYMNISFEREAYANQYNLEYLQTRPRFAFLRYLKKRLEP